MMADAARTAVRRDVTNYAHFCNANRRCFLIGDERKIFDIAVAPDNRRYTRGIVFRLLSLFVCLFVLTL